MPAYKLTYFNIKGRGEMIRLAFAAAGVEYEDCRLTPDEYTKLKSSGKLPFGKLPILEFDGKTLAQSDTILKYVARETGLAPTESYEIAKADMVDGCCDDIMLKAWTFSNEKDEEKKEGLKTEFYKEYLPEAFEMLEKILKSHGGKYFADSKLTYADIKFFWCLDLLFDPIKDTPPALDDYPLLKDHYVAVSNNPGMKKWLNERPGNPQ